MINLLILWQKLAFNAEKLEEIFSGKTETKTLFRNDIYYNSTAWMPKELNGMLLSFLSYSLLRVFVSISIHLNSKSSTEIFIVSMVDAYYILSII